MLVKRALDKGAIFRDNIKVEDIKILEGQVKILLNNGETHKAYIAIGADGVNSVTAKKTGLLKNRRHLGVCILKETMLDEEVLDEFYTEKRSCYIYPGIDGVTGYAWVFPKKNRLNMGLIHYRRNNKTDKKNLKSIFLSLLQKLKDKKLLPPTIDYSNLGGGIVPVWPLEKTYTDRIILCGDAAGIINPLSGEGIYHAIVSANHAADTIIEAFEEKNFSEDFLSKYEKKWFQDLGEEIRVILPSSNIWRRDYEKLISIVKRDPILTELLLDLITSQTSVKNLRWKITKRYILSLLRHHLEH
ncbi:MAG TPA: NAD(P)/FAD-dependent oxidoreductase [Thermoplasmatales archaeon]|nr:NAD(P)/FAD-dependent oxidoreductase [Thermoplasmatales archaeon]